MLSRTGVQNVLEAGKVMKTICTKGVQNVQVHRVHNGPYAQTCCPGPVSKMCSAGVQNMLEAGKVMKTVCSKGVQNVQVIMIQIHKHVVQDGCPKCVGSGKIYENNMLEGCPKCTDP